MLPGEKGTEDRRPDPAYTGNAPLMLSPATSAPKTHAARRYDPCLSILPYLWVVMAIVAVRVLYTEAGPVLPAPTVISIDPNVAPWWELTVLPRIGDGVAHEIVRYRESLGMTASSAGGETPVFATAADLTRVRGIGPKTLRRIAPYLHFQRCLNR